MIENTPVSAKHLGYLDSLRAIAAIFVVLTHVYLQVVEHQAIPGLAGSFLVFLRFGRCGVDLFIVLSGFCLMLPIVKNDGVLRGGTLNFFKRRAWRILPPYYLAMALSLALIYALIGRFTRTHWDYSLPVTFKGIVTHLILMQDAFGDDFKINHAFWSIAVEWRIYFLFPLLVWAWRRFGGIPTALGSLVSSYIVFRLCLHFIGSSLSAHYIGLFAMGMLATTISFSPAPIYRQLQRWPWAAVTPLTGILALLSNATIWHGNTLPVFLSDYIFGFFSMSLLVLLSRDENSLLHQLLSCGPLVFFGTFAYSIYLIHAPLIQIFWQYIFTPAQENPLLMFVLLSCIATPIIIAISYLFFLVCERPFLRKRKKETMAETEIRAALEPAP